MEKSLVASKHRKVRAQTSLAHTSLSTFCTDLANLLRVKKNPSPAWSESFGEPHGLAQINRGHSFAFTPDNLMIYDPNKINLLPPPIHTHTFVLFSGLTS